jgi:hypothetical protein
LADGKVAPHLKAFSPEGEMPELRTDPDWKLSNATSPTLASACRATDWL